MSHAWFLREVSGNSWASRTGEAGVINGSATVLDSVERDQLLVWTQNGSVETDLSLLWQLQVSAATAVESELHLEWNLITEAGSSVDSDLVLLWQRAGSVDVVLPLIWQVGDVLDAAGTVAAVRRAPVRHPGWSRKQAADVLARERAMERSIREVLNPTPPPSLVQKPPQRTSAQMAAEMASAQTARAARQRAVELGAEAQRARVEIERLQPELMQRRQQASFRVIEQLLGNL